jgi:hypothetical protein
MAQAERTGKDAIDTVTSTQSRDEIEAVAQDINDQTGRDCGLAVIADAAHAWAAPGAPRSR